MPWPWRGQSVDVSRRREKGVGASHRDARSIGRGESWGTRTMVIKKKGRGGAGGVSHRGPVG